MRARFILRGERGHYSKFGIWDRDQGKWRVKPRYVDGTLTIKLLTKLNELNAPKKGDNYGPT